MRSRGSCAFVVERILSIHNPLRCSPGVWRRAPVKRAAPSTPVPLLALLRVARAEARRPLPVRCQYPNRLPPAGAKRRGVQRGKPGHPPGGVRPHLRLRSHRQSPVGRGADLHLGRREPADLGLAAEPAEPFGRLHLRRVGPPPERHADRYGRHDLRLVRGAFMPVAMARLGARLLRRGRVPVRCAPLLRRGSDRLGAAGVPACRCVGVRLRSLRRCAATGAAGGGFPVRGAVFGEKQRVVSGDLPGLRSRDGPVVVPGSDWGRRRDQSLRVCWRRANWGDGFAWSREYTVRRFFTTPGTPLPYAVTCSRSCFLPFARAMSPSTELPNAARWTSWAVYRAKCASP
jgi:hypothetical protein